MGGGLMQLVAYGAQDIYLTGNPQITFFKVVYRRHTNFAVESIEQNFSGAVGFDRRVTATISRNGDLIKDMVIEAVLPTVGGTSAPEWVYGVGNAMIKECEIEIGGQLIDRHYGEWMNIWTELSIPEGLRAGYDNMVLNHADGTVTGQAGDAVRNNADGASGVRVYVPLQFWFCRNPGLALPLIALQYHEVKLNITTRALNELVTGNDATAPTGTLSTFKLYVDYVYLDTDERRRFAQVSHEYLIEQVQFTGDESTTTGGNKNATLNFNHPVKELIWVCRESVNGSQTAPNGNGNRWFNFNGAAGSSSAVTEAFTTAKLQLNGHDRFTERNADYFRKVQNFQHHTRVPRATDDTSDSADRRLQMIYTYSFALKPEEHQPSGTCNFSRIDNAVLQLGSVTIAGVLKVFAVNYNVLRIMSGMGGLAYSN
jgi:hypothetical protein